MKIAVNTRFLLPSGMEGIGWFTYQVTKRLVDRHPEHQFYFFFDRQFDPEHVFGPNVQPMVLPPPARHPFLWYAWFEWAVPRALKKVGADVFFSPDGYASLRAKTATSMVMHDIAYAHYPEQVPFLARKYYQYYVPRYLERADQVVTVSKHGKQDILNEVGINADKIQVACNGCREIFQPLDVTTQNTIREKYSEGKPYFFYVGAVHPRKNVDRLIHAFTKFKEQTGAPHQLLIAGRFAWQSNESRQAFENSPYRQEIKLLGYLGQDELPLLMGSAFALAYVSLFEGFGVPILEAMQCEVPVLTSNVSSMPEVAGKAGLLVDPTSIERMAEGMARMANEPTLRNRLMEAGRIQREKFSWERATDVVEASIAKLHP